MAVKKKAKPAAGGPPKIFEADLVPGPSGGVLKGKEIDFNLAVAWRKAGENIVICGDSIKENRQLASTIEAAVGPWERQGPHDKRAGPLSLPHFQQKDRGAKGHSFYETENRRAKAQP